jgi:hypothetical protein
MAGDVIYIFGGIEYDQSPGIRHYDVLAYAPSNDD